MGSLSSKRFKTKNNCQIRHSRNFKKDEEQYDDEVEEIKRQINHLNSLLNKKSKCLAAKMGQAPNVSNARSRKS